MSSSQPLSPAALRFLTEEVQSVLQLELLLVLARDVPSGWTADDAARELRAPEPWVQGQFAALADRGIAAPHGDGDVPAYRLARAGTWAPAIAEIGGAYPQRRTTIIEAIFAEAPEPGSATPAP